MIGKITKGSSGRALIRYLFGPGKANEHTDQRVVTSALSVGIEEGRLLDAAEIAGLGAAIDAANDRFGTNPPGGHIWHVSLSIPGADRPIVDDEWAEMAQRVMSALGFEAQGIQPAAWVAIGHGTSASGNQHIHIAASLVRMDGRQVNIWQDRKTLSRVCAEIEKDYGLSIIEGREGKGMPGLSRAELERTATERLPEPPRITLARLVREASVASKDEAEFVRRLRGSGALVRPRFETGGQHTVVGYSVALKTRASDTPIWFGGGKLAKDLTLPHLREFWEVSKNDQGSRRRMECCQGGCSRPRGAPWSPRGLETGGGKCREVDRTIASRTGVRSRCMAWGGSGSRRAVRRLVETPGREQPGISGGNSRRTGSIAAEPTR
jgi:Relaxase/Mobilisation nuclease domain